jgi:hypothetical protein
MGKPGYCGKFIALTNSYSTKSNNVFEKNCNNEKNVQNKNLSFLPDTICCDINSNQFDDDETFDDEFYEENQFEVEFFRQKEENVVKKTHFDEKKSANFCSNFRLFKCDDDHCPMIHNESDRKYYLHSIINEQTPSQLIDFMINGYYHDTFNRINAPTEGENNNIGKNDKNDNNNQYNVKQNDLLFQKLENFSKNEKETISLFQHKPLISDVVQPLSSPISQYMVDDGQTLDDTKSI